MAFPCADSAPSTTNAFRCWRPTRNRSRPTCRILQSSNCVRAGRRLSVGVCRDHSCQLFQNPSPGWGLPPLQCSASVSLHDCGLPCFCRALCPDGDTKTTGFVDEPANVLLLTGGVTRLENGPASAIIHPAAEFRCLSMPPLVKGFSEWRTGCRAIKHGSGPVVVGCQWRSKRGTHPRVMPRLIAPLGRASCCASHRSFSLCSHFVRKSQVSSFEDLDENQFPAMYRIAACQKGPAYASLEASPCGRQAASHPCTEATRSCAAAPSIRSNARSRRAMSGAAEV